MAMAAVTEDDAMDALDVKRISLASYLQSVMDAVDPSYRMWVTEQHRKKMIRCLMGYNSKSEFDLKLANVHLSEQWEKTHRFVEQDLASLQVDEIKAPQYKEGIQQKGEDPKFAFHTVTQQSQTQRATPARFFSFLARGRTYQGRLLKLLEDVAPHLIPTYQDIVQEPNDIDLMRKLVLEESKNRKPTGEDDADVPPVLRWKGELLQLLEKDFDIKAVPPPDNGGKQMGLQGEVDLTSYLQQEHSLDSCTLVLSNVFVKPPNKHFRNNNQFNNHKPKVPHVILSDIKLAGMTSEFDAMAVQMNPTSNSIELLELWEAKASLHPISIYDVLFKKVGALERILADPDARIHFCAEKDTPQVREVLGGDEGEPLLFPFSSTSALQIGIFGMDLLGPRSAARRTQFVLCEQRIGESPEAVLEALETGLVSPPDVMPILQKIMDEAHRLQPVLVVPESAVCE